MKWINDPDPSERVLWVNGPFGNGKSAIMQKVAETFSSDPQLKHLLAGSFFFGRGKPGRDKAEYLVPTIAYQIANNIPWMRKPIDAALSRDLTILDKSIRAQLRYLITEPFHLTLNSSPSQLGHQSCTPFHTPTVIIDGLDECEGRDSQRLIINAISDAVFKDQVKLRFLIASRSEPQIHELFLTQPLYQNYHPIVLVDDFETRAEILQHLRSGFDDICKRKRDLMYSVQKPWPSERDLRELTRRASGQFLYVATVLRFVGSDETHPVRQLEIILTRQHGSVAAFSSMDELYSLILESCSSQETLPSLLQSLVFLHDNPGFVNVNFRTQTNVEVISGLRAGDISVILRSLSAVIAVKRVEEDEIPDDYPFQDFIRYYSPIISVHHQSFIEFLTDKARSRKFFIAMNTAWQEITDRLDALIVECLSKRESPLGHTVHLSTLALVQERFGRARIESTSWPRLQTFLHDPRKSWDPHPLKPTLERCNALSVVCGALRSMQYNYFANSDGMPSLQTLADTKKYLDVCTSIFDEEYLKVLSSVSKSAMWRIASALSLPHLHESRPGQMCIVKLSRITGFSVQEIFGILDESQYIFNVSPRFGQQRSIDVWIKRELHMFLQDEGRSRDAYSKYRSSVILEFRSKIVESSSLLAPSAGHIFSAFTMYKWDIHPNTDLQEGSAMHSVIDLLYQRYRRGSDHHGDLAQLRWLCRQRQIVNSLPEHESVASKLRNLIDFVGDRFIKSYFQWRLRLTINLPPFSVQTGFVEPNSLVLHISQHRSDTYSEISFLWRSSDGISPERHTAIAKYYTSILLLVLVSRDLSDEDRKSIYATTDVVQWECHLSQANFTIRNHLLTIHYLFTKRNDLMFCGDTTTAMEWLPISWLRGSLMWFNKHCSRGMDIMREDDQSQEHRDEDDQNEDEEYRDEDYRGEGFESWCEQAIAAKECATGSMSLSTGIPLIFSNPRFNLQFPFKRWPASNGTDTFAGDDGLDID